ncbi:CLUMA_CG005071, isoform A [Clunio marinus]|uniref:CLUMA_CG005071, isoform A n=1 Tax=Clunio marinus TaxID=568069 RepID=A0A1J1HXZ3_9DIPT|nr:CLUMA_CG005071, isoform A [Clunio marinus]
MRSANKEKEKSASLRKNSFADSFIQFKCNEPSQASLTASRYDGRNRRLSLGFMQSEETPKSHNDYFSRIINYEKATEVNGIGSDDLLKTIYYLKTEGL